MIVRIRLRQGPALGLRLAPFVYPSAGDPRVAVLVPGFRETRQVRYFRNPLGDDLAKFNPDVLAATAAQLGWMAMTGRAAALHRGIVVLGYPGETGLNQYERDLLWDVFGVPVFEQYLTRRNRLIASECDAHEGLHLYGSTLVRQGWRIERSLCACGNPHPRMMQAPALAAAGPERLVA